jgi:hypothetical protein
VRKPSGLILQIGFEGLLHFPSLHQVDRRFGVWLMCRVDPITSTIVLDSTTRLVFNKTDINKVFGIPCDGKRVDDQFCTNKETIPKILTVHLQSSSKNARSIKPSLQIISQKYDAPMTMEQRNAFKVAFIIYIMSTLFNPGARFDYVSYEYWNAIEDSSNIGNYNWCEYVMEKLLDAAFKLKSELKCNSKFANITGCVLFLQVLKINSLPIKLKA